MFLAFITYGFARSSVVQQREKRQPSTALATTPRSCTRALGGNATSTQAAMQRLERRRRRSPADLVPRPVDGEHPPYAEYRFPQALHRPRDQRRAAGADDRSRSATSSTSSSAIPLPDNGRLLRVLQPRRGHRHAASRRLSLVLLAVITTALGRARRPCSRPGAPCARWATPPRRPRRSPAAGSTPGWNRPTTPTCSVLANSFNDMAQALQTRVERDARFASDVSHELRSPLDDAVGIGRGDGGPPRRVARARPGRARSACRAT